MQGTIVMLMALSGLGCHHKSCDVAYVPSYYGTGPAPVPATPTTAGGPRAAVATAANAGGAVGCGSSRFPCHGCLLSGLFYCFGGWGGSWKQGHGLFAGHHPGYDHDDYGGDYYSTSYSDYSPAVFGSSIPVYETPMTAGQGTAPPRRRTQHPPRRPPKLQRLPHLPQPSPTRPRHPRRPRQLLRRTPRRLPLRRCRPLRPRLRPRSSP